MRDIDQIRDYHAHVYFDAATRDVALRVRAELGERFAVQLGGIKDEPIGPHPLPMYQVAFAPAELARVLPWLMLNRSGLTILIHPSTDDPVADHETHPLWLGTPVALNIEFVRDLVRRRGAAAAG